MKITAIVLSIVGACLLAAGLVLGLGGVHRGGVTCGSGLGGVNDHGLVADFAAAIEADAGTNPGYDPTRSIADDCRTAVSDRATVSWTLLVPGGLLLVGALFVAGFASRQQPTVALKQHADISSAPPTQRWPEG